MGEYTVTVTPSTTWEWKRVMMKPPARAMSTAPKGPGSRDRQGRAAAASKASARAGKLFTVKYRGGSEGWVELADLQGNKWRIPGHMAIVDVIHRLFGDFN